MEKIIYHIHHIIPRHMGGSDDPSNLKRVTIAQHAEEHRLLWEKHEFIQDYIAWKMLSGQIDKAEAIKLLQSKRDVSYMRTEEYRNKISKANKGKKPWNYGKKGVQNMSHVQGKNHYSARSFTFKGKHYDTFKECEIETGVSRYFIQKDPSTIYDP